ncbi:MAG TPA: hypothetical protein VK966_04330 [Longimicrobiales bacterium]|nr:hypothetical protein [Longimicrobiales bacterium]
MAAHLKEADAPSRRRRLALQGVGLVLVLAVAVWANLYAAEHDFVRVLARRFSYPGVFLAAAISGFNLVVPIPVIAFFPFFMEVGFHPVVTVAVIAAGMTTGDLVGYVLGRATREVFAAGAQGVVARLEALRARHRVLPFVVMFLYAAFAPLPNELLVIPLAFLRFRVAGVFLAVLGGNLIFNSLMALGVTRVFEVI